MNKHPGPTDRSARDRTDYYACFTMRMTREEHEALRQVARATDRSISAVVRRAVRRYVLEHRTDDPREDL